MKYFIIALVVVLAVFAAYYIGKQQNEIDNKNTENTEKVSKEDDSITKKNINYRNNWNQFITYDKPHRDEDYTSFALGGVKDLSVIFYNKTDYTIESILLNIDYLNPQTGKIRETKIFEINDLYPTLDGKRISLPNSDVGQIVEINIIKIKSKNLHFCYESEYDNTYGISGNSDDPWKCN